MKLIITVLTLFASFQATAAQDSVAVFFNPSKTVVLVNEQYPDRLQAFMDQMAVAGELHLLSEDESFKIDCGRTAQSASCTFRLLPSPTVQFGHKAVAAAMPVAVAGTFATNFESSRGDQFHLELANGILALKANKAK